MKWLLSRWFPSSRNEIRTIAQRPNRRRLHLEALEERAVPATLHVTNMTSDNAATVGTLRHEINNSTAGDTIQIDVAGTLQLNAANGALRPTHALIIKGLGPNQDIIRAGGRNQIFQSSTQLSLSGLTLTGANTLGAGGAVSELGGLLTIENCILTSNTSLAGGAVFSAAGLTIRNSTFSGNTAAIGGAINVAAGPTTIDHSTISGNRAATAGGIFILGSSLTMTNSIVSGNTATVTVGGIAAVGTTNIDHCTISGNSAGTGDGGGFASTAIRSNVTITASTISGNTAKRGAGVFFNSTASSATIANSTITGNRATGVGGGVATMGGVTLNLVNDTIVGNTSANGGGLYVLLNAGTTTAKVLNTIVANNTDTSRQAPDISGKVTAIHSLIRSTTGTTFVGSTATDIFGVDPRLGPLQFNGGPTQTMALLAGSLALDAGDDSVLGLPYSLTTDQRGYPRKAGSHVDIGAFEFQPPPPPPPPVRRGRIF